MLPQSYGREKLISIGFTQLLCLLNERYAKHLRNLPNIYASTTNDLHKAKWIFTFTLYTKNCSQGDVYFTVTAKYWKTIQSESSFRK